MTFQGLTDGWDDGRLFLWIGPTFGTALLETGVRTFGGIETLGSRFTGLAGAWKGIRFDSGHVAIPEK
jgi:hypothetical protein